MTVLRYTGATAREAMRLVRAALGEDALIIANREVEGGVEILATSEDHLAAMSQAGRADPATVLATAGAPALPGTAAEPEVLDAIGALRGALENRMDGMLWGDRLRRAPAGVAVYRDLLGAGFSTVLARALAERLPPGLDHEQAMQWARGELADKLPVQTDDAGLLASGGVFALVGPTGVGKTTTTAKLAARCVMRYGADKVAMLTTDGYRIGAHEQLLIYGRILGIPVLPAGDGPALQQALAELRGKHIVLVDTVGMSQRDRNVAEQAAMLCGAGRPVRRLLLLNAASHGDTLDEVAHAYRQEAAGGLTGCIITKIDEATHLGSVLDTAIRHRLPVHYVCTGQKVPENFALPQAAILVERAFAYKRGPLFAPSEADFGAMWSVVQAQAQAQAQAQVPDAQDEHALANLAPVVSKAVAQQRLRSRRNLRAAVAGGFVGAQGEFDQALAAMQDTRVFALAQQAWREYVPGETGAAELTDSLLADVRAHAGDTCERYLLAAHGRLRPPPPGRSPAWSRQTGSILFSDRTEVLASPARHLLTAQGVMASFEAGGAQTAALASQTPLARAGWLAAQLRVPMVHLFDGFSGSLALHMRDRSGMWLARCPAPQAVIWQDARITVGALAKMLGHMPAGRVRYQGRACTRWVGHADVSLPTRRSSQAEQPLRLVSTRLLAEDTGECLRQLAGLAVVDDAVDARQLASWLALVDAVPACNDWAQAAIDTIGGRHALADGPEAAAHMLLGAQLGLAGWHLLRQAPDAGAALLGSLVAEGGSGALQQRAVIDKLIRLFASLEMLESVA